MKWIAYGLALWFVLGLLVARAVGVVAGPRSPREREAEDRLQAAAARRNAGQPAADVLDGDELAADAAAEAAADDVFDQRVSAHRPARDRVLRAILGSRGAGRPAGRGR